MEGNLMAWRRRAPPPARFDRHRRGGCYCDAMLTKDALPLHNPPPGGPHK
ncbi:hypothetical protein TcasGA2_TC034235 [Tribolium castaneum]|uniref:Uncharacterized protein n=1 Tax=Tribolium castaneum TaxID=7070 RepID=A0A139WC89_TRICA|nr:hypothetical protein TcasGA2_TC034235 [Tribolium castaneum]